MLFKKMNTIQRNRQIQSNVHEMYDQTELTKSNLSERSSQWNRQGHGGGFPSQGVCFCFLRDGDGEGDADIGMCEERKEVVLSSSRHPLVTFYTYRLNCCCCCFPAVALVRDVLSL